jgi:hypothetical protein
MTRSTKRKGFALARWQIATRFGPYWSSDGGAWTSEARAGPQIASATAIEPVAPHAKRLPTV